MVGSSLLMIILLLSFYFDCEYRIIPNFLTFFAIVSGWIIAFSGGLDIFYHSLLATLVGTSILFIPYLLDGVGGGDVKLLAGIGSLTNVQFILYTSGIGLIIAGVVSLYLLIKTNRLKNAFKILKNSANLKTQKPDETAVNIPLGSYLSGVAIILIHLNVGL